MKVVYRNYWLLPPPGFTAISWFGSIIAKKNCEPLSPLTINHEAIHEAQAKECRGWIKFYVRYVWQWMRVGFKYKKNPFEREAYDNERNMRYLETRVPFNWERY